MRRLTYRTRLVVGYTAIFAGALLLFCAIAYVTVRLTLHASTDLRLQTTATAIRSVPDVHHGRLAIDRDDRQQFFALLSENHVNGIVVSADGAVLLSNLERPPAALVAALSATPRSGTIHGSIDADVTPLEFTAYPIEKSGRIVGYVAAWDARAVFEDAARITLVSLLVASLIVILAALAIGRSLIDRMLRPIADLSAMMSEIEAANLSDRLAWDGPDDELGRLCATFDRLLDRLETAFDRERRFSADASHELRTPLTVMRAEVELALLRDRDAGAYRATLGRLRLETQRLEALIESLLLTARRDTGLSDARPITLADVAAQATARMEPIAALREIELLVERLGEPAALADPTLLESALVALLDNAIRHTPPGGLVRIIVAARDARASIAVIDGGSGFSEAALANAAERFWRDDEARSGGGTGLGLAIVRTIVERHGGTIALRNGHAGGAIVELTFPALPPADQDERAKSGVIGNTVGSSA
jgi:signal transduction histidine kinase